MRLQGRLNECVSRVCRDVAQGVCTSYANVIGMSGEKVVSGASGVSERTNVVVRIKERSYVVIVRAKDVNAKMTSEQVKEKVRRDVSKSLNVRVKTVRKTKRSGVAIETE